MWINFTLECAIYDCNTVTSVSVEYSQLRTKHLKMFCVIRLKQSKEILVINQNQIRDFNGIKLHNRGIKHNSKYVIYYCANQQNDEVNFDVQMSQVFQPNVPHLYEAYLRQFFGKCDRSAIFYFCSLNNSLLNHR